MPNWCANHLTVTGPAAARAAFREAAQSGEAELSLAAHVPEPATFPDAASYADHPDPQVRIFAVLPVPGGEPQAWARSNWGTKWDVDPDGVGRDDPRPDDDDAALIYRFDTAWTPPVPWFETVAARHPDLTFIMASCEPGERIGLVMTATGGAITSHLESDPHEIRAELESAGMDLDWLDDE